MRSLRPRVHRAMLGSGALHLARLGDDARQPHEMPCRVGRTQKRVVARAKMPETMHVSRNSFLNSYLSKGRKPASFERRRKSSQEIFGTAFFGPKIGIFERSRTARGKTRETMPRGFFAWCEFNAARARATLRDRGFLLYLGVAHGDESAAQLKTFAHEVGDFGFAVWPEWSRSCRRSGASIVEEGAGRDAEQIGDLLQATGADSIRAIPYFRTCWKLTWSASPTAVRLMPKMSRRICTRAPTCASMGFSVFIDPRTMAYLCASSL